MILLIELLRAVKFVETESKTVVAGAGGTEKRGMTLRGCCVSFGGDENILELDRGDGCTTMRR